MLKDTAVVGKYNYVLGDMNICWEVRVLRFPSKCRGMQLCAEILYVHMC